MDTTTIRILLICVVFLVKLDSTFCDSDSEPTATLSLVNSDNGSGKNRYALQISGDQLTGYLRTLRHVPESIYNEPHIITDMEESALSTRYETPDEDDRHYSDQIPAMRLYQQQDAESSHQDEDEPEQDYPPKKKSSSQDYDYESSSSRKSIEYRLPYRINDFLRTRDLISRREEVAAAVAAVAAEQETKAKEVVKEFLKAKDIEDQKDKDEVISLKDQRSRTEIDAPVVVEKTVAGKQEKQEDNIDLKTVRELLNTLIKQIEIMQAAAKALPFPFPTGPMPMPMPMYSNKRDLFREESYEEPDPIPRKVKNSSYEPKKRPVQHQGRRQRQNIPERERERRVYLKPQEVVKMLTGAPLPSDIIPEVAPIGRSRGPYMASGGGKGSRMPFLMNPYFGYSSGNV